MLHGMDCKLYGWEEPDVEACELSLHWAGTICLDIMTFGSRRGVHGPHSTSWLLWCYERRMRRENIVFCENGPLWPLEVTEKQLGDIDQATLVLHCVFCFMFLS